MHRGNETRRIVDKLGYTLSDLADKMNVARNTLYAYFSDPNLSKKKIEAIGSAIEYDFSQIFGDYISNEPDPSKVNDSPGDYRRTEKAMLSIELDGSDEGLDRLITKLRILNDALKNINNP